ncbi:related to transposase [Desulfotalea psychrophila LSv54]|uniref:Related to transposase n=1 Tax=Desulfotalea psychrophila (strain LSv54 / DSM 12343) TaxID=177439 RepID=Q6AS99_DESPS|nr:related to transposase [Desulfotalea psychrophila LSv54]
MDIDLQAPEKPVGRRAQTVKVNYRLPSHGPIKHIDSTGLNHGEGEWSVRKHGASKRRTWRKIHLAIDAEIDHLSGEISLERVHDSKVLKPLHRRIEQISGDGVEHKIAIIL